MPKRRINSTRKKKIRKLLSMMNKQNQRFIPIAPPLIEMMDLVTSEEEIDFLIRMGREPYDFDHAKLQSKMAGDRFTAFFDELQRKGYIHIEGDSEGKERYSLAAIAVGWYETMMHYSVGKIHEREFSEKWDQFFRFFKTFNFFPLRNIQDMAMRRVLKPSQDTALMAPRKGGNKDRVTIPVDNRLTHETKIYPSFLVDDLVEEYGKKESIYVFPCVCRHGNDVIGSECNFDIPRESCMAFGSMAKAWEGWGYGRSVSKEEAFDILAEVQDKGAIHSVIHEKDDCRLPVSAICNCCWDCCGILKPYNMGAVSIMYNASFLAHIKDDADCKACGSCEKFCPTTAMKLVDKKVVLDEGKCIGCGQCALHCQQDNIEMLPNERSVYLPLLKKNEVRVSF